MFVVQCSQQYAYDHKCFRDLLLLFRARLLDSEWWPNAGRDDQLRLLQCLRLLLRDDELKSTFTEVPQAFDRLAELFVSLANALFHLPVVLTSECVTELASIFKNFATLPRYRRAMFERSVHRTLALLLSSDEFFVLQTVIVALTHMASSTEFPEAMQHLHYMEPIVQLLSDSERALKAQCAELVARLALFESCRTELQVLGATPVIFNLLESDDHELVALGLRILTATVLNRDTLHEIKATNRIVDVVRLLDPTQNPLVVHADVVCLSCSLLCNLVVDRDLSGLVRAHGGIELLGLLLLDRPWGNTELPALEQVFQTMRFLFGLERNRKVFKKIFPVHIFTAFVDVGPYVRDLTHYQPLVQAFQSATGYALSTMRASIDTMRAREAQVTERQVGEYILLDLLGQGAYGSVWEATMPTRDLKWAVKEVPLSAASEINARPDRLQREVEILSHLHHPNVVRFYKSFVERNNLYIVMELVEGVTLEEFIVSYSEKGLPVPEKLAWNVFVQICTALRYLHLEKNITHRDLKPQNIMVDSAHNVKLMDFGLAYQRNQNSMMHSMVGTIQYCCPEIVHNKPYNEKADIWALGCILYQMATSRPPFAGDNPLAVAYNIADARYEPIDPSSRSSLMIDVIKSLLVVDPTERPDILQVSRLIAPVLLSELDSVLEHRNRMHAELEYERQEKVKYEQLAMQAREQYYRLLLPYKESPTAPGPPTRMQTAGRAPPSTPARPKTGHTTISTVTGTVSIPAQRLRAIEDPLVLMLNIVHKIAYIMQLPPNVQRDPNRRFVLRYARELFSSRAGQFSLKAELKKLLSASTELINIDFGSHASESEERPDASPSKRIMLSYAQMLEIIEDVLANHHYYDIAV